jgi:transcriptional regulator with AAA-type ATPase domain
MIEEKNKIAYEKATNRKNGSHATKLEKLKDLIKAQEALNELRDKIKAIEDLNDRANEQRIYANKANKMALDEKTKYEKRWGGIK